MYMEQIFKKVKSSDFCSKIFDGTHDSPKYHETGFPLVTSKCILDSKIIISEASLISSCDFEKINKRSEVQLFDILVSMIGINAGIVGLIKEKPKFAIKNVGVFRCECKLDSKYLFYFLQSKKGISLLKSARAGSAQPYISLEKLRTLDFIIPTNKNYQQHIVNSIRRYSYVM